MDPTRFDTLTRFLATPSRRGILAMLVAAVGGSVVEDEVFGKNQPAKRRKRREDRRQQGEGAHESVDAERRRKKKKKKKSTIPIVMAPPSCNPPCPTCKVCRAGQCVDNNGAACGRGGHSCQGGVCACPAGQEDSGGVCAVRPTCVEPGATVGTNADACCSRSTNGIGQCSCSLGDEQCQTNNDCCELDRPCIGFVCASTCYQGYPHDPACQGYCPADADYCKSGTPTCSRDGFCLQPIDGGSSRCGRHNASTDGSMCNCTSHEECVQRTGQAGAFCAKVSGRCSCPIPTTGGGSTAGTTFCVTPR